MKCECGKTPFIYFYLNLEKCALCHECYDECYEKEIAEKVETLKNKPIE